MVIKIQRPIISTAGDYYLAYNKSRNTIIDDIEVGQFPKLDEMFEEDELKIYVEGYIDKKDRFIIKRKVENQDW